MVNTTYLESVKVRNKPINHLQMFAETNSSNPCSFAGEEALRLPAHSPRLRRVGQQDGDQVEGGEHHQVNFL